MNRWYIAAIIQSLLGIGALFISCYMLAGGCFGISFCMILNGINKYDL